MKNLVLIASLLIFGGFSASAEVSGSFAEGIVIGGNDEKISMQLDQLPEGVVKTLDGARFTGWKPVLAYKVKESASVCYEITFVRDEEVITLRLNEDGGKIG
jgi:hypothetical protein